VGGLTGLLAGLEPKTLNLLPDFSDWGLALAVFVIPLTVQWWSVWYPGAEPGGGSYVAQRMLAARSERDALTGTLLYNVAHYALRPWPWIIVGLCSLLVFPTLPDLQHAFPHVESRLIGHDMAYPAMLTFLPAGFLGLMVAGLLAAYVSTISTHLNWGTSYLVHDFYRRFVRGDASERHYVLVSRIITTALMLLAAALTFVIDTARHGFDLLLSVGAGTGLIYLLRWFWWRINAWSEISAMIGSVLVATGFSIANRNGAEIPSHIALVATVGITTLIWVAVTLLTPPTDRKVLHSFYAKIRPAGPGWRNVRAETGLAPSRDSLSSAVLAWAAGVLFVYAALFGTGSLLYGRTSIALFWLVLFLCSGFILFRLLPKLWGSAHSD
jgi:Na+/proline symporter